MATPLGNHVLTTEFSSKRFSKLYLDFPGYLSDLGDSLHPGTLLVAVERYRYILEGAVELNKYSVSFFYFQSNTIFQDG